ncbi:hypothetical protein BH11PSE3_BH11PSE3_26290 [soil metagenome]
MTLNRRFLVAAFVALSLAGGGNAIAQGQPIVGMQTVTTYSSEGRITAVDTKARTVTITFPNGATRTHDVSPTVANFSATRMNDSVAVGFEDKLTFVLSGPNTAVPRTRDDSAVAVTSTGGQNVTGIGAAQSIDTWWVVAVDPARGALSLVNPGGGAVRTYLVSQAGREQLPRVKVGDSLTAINSQVMVISITPKP